MADEKTFQVPTELLLQAPAGVIGRLQAQLERWFDVPPTRLNLIDMDFVVRTNHNTPAEWVLLLEALSVGHWTTVEVALGLVEKVRKDSIKRRDITARVINAAG